MEDFTINSPYVLLQVGFTHRILDDYEKYKKAINKDNTMELIGITTDKDCYGHKPNTPFYYPQSVEIKNFYNKGCIIIKLKDKLCKNKLSKMINEINDFCEFFTIETILKYTVDNDFILIEFDTESG